MSKPTVKKDRKAKAAHGVAGGTREANRLAVAILEVLAGVRTPVDAAQALGISLPRYYQLETRAVEGLVEACEPRPKGRVVSPGHQLAQLQRQLQQAQAECARQQALARIAQRSVGLKPATPPVAAKTNGQPSKRRRRQPTVRALKAADVLREKLPAVPPDAVQTEVVNNP